MFGIKIAIKEIAQERQFINTDYAVVNGRWHLNNRSFEELTTNERSALAERIKTY